MINVPPKIGNRYRFVKMPTVVLSDLVSTTQAADADARSDLTTWTYIDFMMSLVFFNVVAFGSEPWSSV